MVCLDHVKLGISRYVDAEIMSKVNGLNKWLVGAMITTIPSVIDNKYKEYKSTLMDMGIVTLDDQIDIQKAEDILIASATKYGKADMDLGGVRVTLGCDDIRKVSTYIQQL